jgi:putative Holliday junction resolvase
MGRLIGIDPGSKTLGLAMSDGLRTIATPLETIKRTKFSKDLLKLQAIVKEHAICGLVLGYPVNMDGSEGPRCQSVRQLASNLQQAITLPTLLWDERLSTAAVERTMLAADLSRQRRSELVDKLAASYILQGVLDGMG